MEPSPENPSPDNTPEDVASIHFDLACVHCEASLNGAPLDGECPACHKPVADTLDPDAVDLNTATVSADIPCPQCGYNLRTLSITGVCPECAHAVAPALQPHPLSATDPAWRKRVLSGIRWLFFVIIATPVSTIAIVILMSLGLTIPGSFDILMTFAIGAILLAGLAAGIFAVSARSEQGFNQHASAWPHIVARAGILLSLILFILAHGVSYLIMTGSSHAVSHVMISWTAIGSSIFDSASLIAAGLCLRRIARLARDARLIKRTNTWLVLYAIVASLGIVIQIVGIFTPIFALTASGPEKLLVAIQIFTALGGLIAFVLAIFALLAYRKLLRSADTRRASDVRRSRPRPHAMPQTETTALHLDDQQPCSPLAPTAKDGAFVPLIGFDLACVHCARPLEGAPLDGECPACHKPVANTLDPDAIDLATATVSTDISCPQCGYNLRTLGIGSVCPECNHAVSLALRPPPLSVTDPAWRKQVLSGINRLLFFLLGLPVFMIATMLGEPLGDGRSNLPLILAMLVMESCLLVTLTTGIFRASTRDRQTVAPPASAIPRIIARTAIILAGILVLWAHAQAWLGTAFLPQAMQHAASDAAIFLPIVFCLITSIGAGFCLRQIVRRARKKSLMIGTNVWLVFFTSAATLGASGITATSLAPLLGHRFPSIESYAHSTDTLSMIAALAHCVLALLGLIVCRELLRRASAPANRRRSRK